MEEFNQEISRMIDRLNGSQPDLDWASRFMLVIGILLVTYFITCLFRHFLIPVIQKITTRTKAKWDDYLFNKEMLTAFCRIIPPIVMYILLPFAFKDMAYLLAIIQKGCTIYIIIAGLRLISQFLNSLYEISNEHERLKNRPLKGIYQMINLIAIGIGVIVIISILIDRDATSILAGLGASAAVLMLIFKDSILGLVAGVQLSANDMLRPGDWITMPKYNADGDVTEVSLTTVKVRNFDKTITTIPPYALVSDSFQNWRGMKEIGGRRIKRSLLIDMNTVHFCSPEETKRFLSLGWISEETAKEPQGEVNLNVLRNYLLQYLKKHPMIHQEMMIMVRQLQPTPEGLPLEVYCFSNTTEWYKYEALQAEIFDHFIAILPQFGLKVYQRPSGNDLQNESSTQTFVS